MTMPRIDPADQLLDDLTALRRRIDALERAAAAPAPRALYFGTAWDLATSGTTLLVATTVPITVAAKRAIRATVILDRGWYGSTVGDVFTIALRVGGVVMDTTPVQIVLANGYVPPGLFVVQFYGSLAAGAHTFDVTCQRTTGSGTFQFRGRLAVDDLGAAT